MVKIQKVEIVCWNRFRRKIFGLKLGYLLIGKWLTTPLRGTAETVLLSGKISSYHIWCGGCSGCGGYGIRCMLG
jgi:hypothetical protein